MQISCEKCQTAYVLDDRLVPPTGAPVQCTRCGHVFTAYPPSAQDPARQTQVFGLGAVDAPRQTQIFGASSPARSQTQMFGAVNAAGEPVPAEAPQRRETQMFAVPTGGAPAAPPAPEPPRSGTQVFGAVSPDALPEPVTTPELPGAPEAPVRHPTLHFGAASLPAEPEPAPRAAPDTPALKGAVPAFDPPSAGRTVGPSLPRSDVTTTGTNPELRLRRQLRSRSRRAMWAVGLLVVGLGGWVAYRSLPARREVPDTALATKEQAWTLIRKDDSTALRQAADSMGAVLRDHPTYVEGHATRLLALVLLLDNAKAEVKHYQQAAERLTRRIERLKDGRKTGDWEARVNGLIDELGLLKQRSDPKVDAAAALEGEVSAAFKELAGVETPELTEPEQRALVRARAVYYGVKGSDQALALAERYRRLSKGTDDGWAALAVAEYSLNARVAPQTLADAKAGLDEVRSKDSTWLRPYVLAARVAQLQKKEAVASELLEAVRALNRNHDMAERLLEWGRAGSP